MKQIHLFEFADLPWYPQIFRSIQTDYLQFVATRGSAHKNLIPLLAKALKHAGTNEIVDLCSGGSGPWFRLRDEFEKIGWQVNVKLTDKYPQPEIIQRWSKSSQTGIKYIAEPVDATQVPLHLQGMRTLFEGFHHFKPEQARSILLDAAEKRAAIGVFEISLKPPFGFFLLLLAPLTTIISYLVLSPFIQPRTWSRFIWTYLLPLVPLATCWDGVISLLRVYSETELKEMTERLDCKDYQWEIGQVSTGTPVFVYCYLIGYPLKAQQ